jgi:uncharacterized protein
MPLRFDRTTSNKVTKTKDGFLRAETHVAKVGILKYRLLDGTVRSEYVPPETLFDSESMETLKLIPVVMEHAGMQKINVKNAKQHQIGTTGETVKADSAAFLDASMVVTDEKSIEQIEQGSNEISCCYDAVLIEKPGSFNGEPYTHVQTKRVYNHISFTKRGRAGSDIALRFDSLSSDDGVEEVENFDGGPGSGKHKAAYHKFHNEGPQHMTKEEFQLAREHAKRIKDDDSEQKIKDAHNERFESKMDSNISTSKKEKRMNKILINGIEYEVPAEVKVAFDSLNSDMVKVKADAEKSKGEKDAVQAKYDSTVAEMPAKINAGIQERITLLKTAEKILPKETKLDSMDNAAIRKEIIKIKLPKISLDGKSEEYVQACFDSAIEAPEVSKIPEQRAQSATKYDTNSIPADIDADVARQAYIDKLNGKK